MRETKSNNPVRRFIDRQLRNHKARIQRPKVWLVDEGIDKKWGYVEIPKIASTSITYCISQYLSQVEADTEFSDDSERLTKKYARKYAGHKSAKDIFRQHQDYFLFTFVRNPFARLYSCYADKILKVRDSGHNILWSHGFELDMDFSDFVSHLSGISDVNVNRHLKSQSFFVCHQGKPIVSYVGKFEDVTNEWTFLVDKLGLPALPHSNKSAASLTSYTTHYTPEIARMAYDRYKLDIELFGYADELKPLLG